MTQADPQDYSASVHRAREVVGLYGDPTTTWGIGTELSVGREIDLAGAPRRLDALVRQHPHLGRPPTVDLVAPEQWDGRRMTALSSEFGADGYLVRVLVSPEHRRILVAAHHGVCDGLGLLGIAEAVLQAGLAPQARGIGTRATSRSFLVSGITRVTEALVRPPLRLPGRPTASTGEWLGLTSTPRMQVSTADICWAFARAYDEWPGRRSPGRRPLLVMVGMSRRTRGSLTPDRQTAYMRLSLDLRGTREGLRERFAGSEPEPDFPETSAKGLGPLVTRMLRNRLGATAMVSNLGSVRGDGLVSLAMFPALNGPQAVGIGLASTDQTTTVSLRLRSSDFSAEDGQTLLESLRATLLSLQTLPQNGS